MNPGQQATAARATTSVMDATPYYQNDLVRLYHADAFELLPRLQVTVDHVITDPPYDDRTHAGARTNAHDGKLVDFDEFGIEDIRRFCEMAHDLGAKWQVFTCAFSHAAQLEIQPPLGLEHIRTGVFRKIGAAPQKTGDRPGQGIEAVTHLHPDDDAETLAEEAYEWIAHLHPPGRKRWNGRGRWAVYDHPVERGLHPTQKPVSLGEEIVRLFTHPGETILEPFCGSGAFALASQKLGRKVIAIELNEEHCETAAKQLEEHWAQRDLFAVDVASERMKPQANWFSKSGRGAS